MMTQQESQGEKFRQMLESFYQATHQDDMLSKVRTNAWNHFLDLGLPTKRNEVFQYIRLRQLFSKEYTLPSHVDISYDQIRNHVLEECQQSYLVIVNGHYREDLSCRDGVPSKVVVTDLKKASRTYSAFLNNHWNRTVKEETDPFAAVNTALHKDSLFLYIPPNTQVDVPLQVIHLVDTPESHAFLTPRLQVFAGRGSEVNIYCTNVCARGDQYHVNQLADFSVDENARVTYTQSALDQCESSWYFDAIRASLKRDSYFKAVNLNDGATTYRQDYRVSLLQENAEAELDGVWMLHGKRESHVNVLIDHQAPNCRSRQMFKGVLRDFSRSSFEGKILVRQAAQQTDAFQLNNNLLLSERSHADSKPNLEIFADDVKASHGATVGRLDEEQLFYMKSRGFSDIEAKNMLIYGYCKEVIDRIDLPSLHNQLKLRAENYIA
ncbi:MAG: Fe-S cluster assembly protein SufD [Chlamydiota bacterium]